VHALASHLLRGPANPGYSERHAQRVCARGFEPAHRVVESHPEAPQEAAQHLAKVVCAFAGLQERGAGQIDTLFDPPVCIASSDVIKDSHAISNALDTSIMHLL
jgi:hypothetical protein